MDRELPPQPDIGHFDMVNLSGSYINDVDGPHGPTAGLNVTFAGPDGRPVEGVLITASHVQVPRGGRTGNVSKLAISNLKRLKIANFFKHIFFSHFWVRLEKFQENAAFVRKKDTQGEFVLIELFNCTQLHDSISCYIT
ncbi:hypothetical protein DH2020_045403 [Rehmannia glutinosa]|uniref:Uncharacterized protein n=1 Tax=Rehmannia glutinosa TaxID=99300 RepID=A0ABR0UEF5_REHGL